MAGGSTNIKKHVEKIRQEALNKIKEAAKMGIKVELNEFKYSKYSAKTFSWLQIILMYLIYFTLSQINKYVRMYMKFGPTSRNTSMKYMGELTTIVEKKIYAVLSDVFALIVDG